MYTAHIIMKVEMRAFALFRSLVLMNGMTHYIIEKKLRVIECVLRVHFLSFKIFSSLDNLFYYAYAANMQLLWKSNARNSMGILNAKTEIRRMDKFKVKMCGYSSHE